MTFQTPTHAVTLPVRVATVISRFEGIHMGELILRQPLTKTLPLLFGSSKVKYAYPHGDHNDPPLPCTSGKNLVCCDFWPLFAAILAPSNSHSSKCPTLNAANKNLSKKGHYLLRSTQNRRK